MQSATPDDVFELVDRYVAAAAMGAALELGVFWLVADEPLTDVEVADRLNISEERCRSWLQLLAELGYLAFDSDRYEPSLQACHAILNAYSRETWAFLAREARERFPAVRDLAVQLGDPGTPWETQGLEPPDYLENLRRDPVRAREFTRMLFEVHLPLAEAIADAVSPGGVDRILDVGGGSGVVSLALLRRHPQARAVVVDLDNVCVAGREIAADHATHDRIEYRALDFLADDLPSGFDLVVYCDVGEFDEQVLHKLRSSLDPGGRLVIVYKFGSRPGRSHPSRTHWALLAELGNTPRDTPTVEELVADLGRAEFTASTVIDLPDLESRWSSGWTLIEAAV